MFATSQQKAYSKIRTMILDGEFKSGERIPETKVAELIGMKRGPVRESLIKLESDGLLVSEPHFGFTVRKYTVDEVRQLYELREFVEGGAAGLAAKNATKVDIARILRAHHEFGEKIERNRILVETYSTLDEQCSNVSQDEAFHRAILKASRNLRFERFFDSMNDQHICLILHCKGEKDNRIYYDIESYEHHKAILDAIISGDSKIAEFEAREHVRHAREGLIPILETSGSQFR